MLKREAKRARANKKSRAAVRLWTSVGARVTFRAEVMPGRDAAERTFTVARLLASNRIELAGLAGEHTATEFESSKERVLHLTAIEGV